MRYFVSNHAAQRPLVSFGTINVNQIACHVRFIDKNVIYPGNTISKRPKSLIAEKCVEAVAVCQKNPAADFTVINRRFGQSCFSVVKNLMNVFVKRLSRIDLKTLVRDIVGEKILRKADG